MEEQKAFQNRIIVILKQNFPNFEIERSDNPLILTWNENQLSLFNLYNDFLLTSQTNFELEELAKEHFGKILSCELLLDEEIESFEQIKFEVLPQIMPIEYIEEFKALHIPLGDEVVIGFVIDGEKAYRYITEDDFENWNVDLSKLKQNAIHNLSEISYDLEMTFVPLPNGMIVVDTMDSFDAVRILVPHLQEFFAEKLGSPFCFGIPNRDFLICWSKTSDAKFQSTIKNQIANDFEERPYSLSKYSFELNEYGEILQNYSDKKDKKREDWINKN